MSASKTKMHEEFAVTDKFASNLGNIKIFRMIFIDVCIVHGTVYEVIQVYTV